MLSFGNGRNFQPFRLSPNDFNLCVKHIPAAGDGLVSREKSATGMTPPIVLPDEAQGRKGNP